MYATGQVHVDAGKIDKDVIWLSQQSKYTQGQEGITYHDGVKPTTT